MLSVIPAEDERDAVAIANDTIYGLNASVFTDDVDRAREVAGQLRVGHRRATTRSGPTSPSPSAGSSSRGSAARVGPRACSRSSRPRRSSWRSARPPVPRDDEQGPPEVEPGDGGAVSFNHIGLCVSDLARSRRFYEDVLGFRYWWELMVPDEAAGPLMQIPPPVGSSAVYLVNDRFVLELIHYADAGVHPAPRRVMNDLGFTHLSVAVADMAGGAGQGRGPPVATSWRTPTWGAGPS